MVDTVLLGRHTRVFQLSAESNIKVSPEELEAARLKVRPHSREETLTRVQGVFMTLKGRNTQVSLHVTYNIQYTSAIFGVVMLLNNKGQRVGFLVVVRVMQVMGGGLGREAMFSFFEGPGGTSP